jgi:hypothetical protein
LTDFCGEKNPILFFSSTGSMVGGGNEIGEIECGKLFIEPINCFLSALFNGREIF